MGTADLLSRIEAQGVTFKAAGDRVLFSPPEALEPEVLTSLRESRTEVLALIKVKQALRQGRRLTVNQLRAETALDTESLYAALGELYDLHELKTNHDGFYWLAGKTVN